MTKPHDLSTVIGRKAAGVAVARSNLPSDLKAALTDALESGRFPAKVTKPKGRPPLQDWEKIRNAIRGMLIDRNAPRGEQTAEIARLAKERNISPAAMYDRITRPNRKRKKP